MTDIDVFDSETWPILSNMRKELRDKLFDEDDPKKGLSLQVQLDDMDVDLEVQVHDSLNQLKYHVL